MNIPKKIKIGAITYTVKIVEGLKSAGEYDGESQLISINKGKNEMMALTLMHEIIHAANNEIEEVEAEFLAQALYQVIKENPNVFRGVSKK